MLIIPITGKISWRNPPAVTIFLIVINCIVLFGFQSNDNQLYLKAHRYYYSSGLAAIEAKRYVAYKRNLEKHADSPQEADEKREMTSKEISQINAEMNNDDLFLKKLRDGEIIKTIDPEYNRWNELNIEYEGLLSKVVFIKYGFIPATHHPVTFFTYMFLHGGMSHLIGNMIFLWIVGCILELGCGRALYSVTYILTGLCSVIFFWLIYPTSSIPLVGASGAIAGLMGAFTVMFGKSRIKTFLYLGFYFNYFRFPAIALLPLWIGNEIYQLFFNVTSNVAYVGHIGGLLSGAIVGFINLRYFRIKNATVFEEEKADEVSPLIEKALHHIGELDFEKARLLLLQALEKDPDNCDIHIHLFHIDKQTPQSDKFHSTARKFLQSMIQDKSTHKKIYDIYQEYSSITKPKLSPDQYVRLGAIFAEEGHIGNAEKIISLLLKTKPDLPGMPTALHKLANAYKKSASMGNMVKCQKILSSKYSESIEGQMATREIKGLVQN